MRLKYLLFEFRTFTFRVSEIRSFAALEMKRGRVLFITIIAYFRYIKHCGYLSTSDTITIYILNVHIFIDLYF